MSDKMHDDEARIPLTVSPIPILVCLSRSSRRHFDPDSHVIVVLHSSISPLQYVGYP